MLLVVTSFAWQNIKVISSVFPDPFRSWISCTHVSLIFWGAFWVLRWLEFPQVRHRLANPNSPRHMGCWSWGSGAISHCRGLRGGSKKNCGGGKSMEIPEVNGGVSGQLSEKKWSIFPASHVCPRDPEGVSKCWNPIPSHGQVHGPLVAFWWANSPSCVKHRIVIASSGWWFGTFFSTYWEW